MQYPDLPLDGDRTVQVFMQYPDQPLDGDEDRAGFHAVLRPASRWGQESNRGPWLVPGTT